MVTKEELEIRYKCEEINNSIRNKNLSYSFMVLERLDQGDNLIDRIIVLEDPTIPKARRKGCEPTSREDTIYSRS